MHRRTAEPAKAVNGSRVNDLDVLAIDDPVSQRANEAPGSDVFGAGSYKTSNYLRLILKVIGTEDVTVVAGGNAKFVDMGETTRAAFLKTIASDVAARGGPT